MSCTCLDPRAIAPRGQLALTPELRLDPGSGNGFASLSLSFQDDEPVTMGLILTDAWARGSTPVGPFNVQRGAKDKLLQISWSAKGVLSFGNLLPNRQLWSTNDPDILGKPLHFTLQTTRWTVANASLFPATGSPYAALCPVITDFSRPSPCARCNPLQPLSCIDFDPSDPRQDLEVVAGGFAVVLALRVFGIL